MARTGKYDYWDVINHITHDQWQWKLGAVLNWIGTRFQRTGEKLQTVAYQRAAGVWSRTAQE